MAAQLRQLSACACATRSPAAHCACVLFLFFPTTHAHLSTIKQKCKHNLARTIEEVAALVWSLVELVDPERTSRSVTHSAVSTPPRRLSERRKRKREIFSPDRRNFAVCPLLFFKLSNPLTIVQRFSSIQEFLGRVVENIK